MRRCRRRWDCIRLLLNSKLPRRLVLLVTNVFGISALLVWREMTLEEAQISDTHSLKEVGVALWYLSITPRNNSGAVVKNLRILVCRSRLRLTIPYLILKI
jgi:hypothetical protein